MANVLGNMQNKYWTEISDPAEARNQLRDQDHRLAEFYVCALFYKKLVFSFGFSGNIQCTKLHRCLNLCWMYSQKLNKEKPRRWTNTIVQNRPF